MGASDDLKNKAKDSASRIKNFLLLGNMKSAMALETKGFKMSIIFIAAVLGLFYLIFASIWFARFDSANMMQKAWKDSPQRSTIEALAGGDVVAYDVGCLLGGEYSDYEEARDWGQKWREDQCDNDKDCMRTGTQWRGLFGANGFMMFFYFLSMVALGIGAYVAIARLIAFYCTCAMCCYGFAMFIATPVLRLQPSGRLCALSKTDTHVTCDEWADKCIDDSWTYEADGAMIVGLYFMQLLCCCCTCCWAFGVTKPSSV